MNPNKNQAQNAEKYQTVFDDIMINVMFNR